MRWLSSSARTRTWSPATSRTPTSRKRTWLARCARWSRGPAGIGAPAKSRPAPAPTPGPHQQAAPELAVCVPLQLKGIRIDKRYSIATICRFYSGLPAYGDGRGGVAI